MSSRAAATFILLPLFGSLRYPSISTAAIHPQSVFPKRFTTTAPRHPRTSKQAADSFIINPSLPSLVAARFSSNQARPSSDDLADGVRQLMRAVPHPVAIVTSTSNYTTDSATHTSRSLDLFRGATVSSFNTVTLTPEPIVSFNITQQSSTFSAIQLSGLFNVHLLTFAPEARAIAAKFALGNEVRPFHDLDGKLERWVDLKASSSSSSSSLQSREAFTALSTIPDSSPSKKGRLPPVIATHTKGALQVVAFRFLCEHLTEKTVSIGDHVVVFGRVIEAVDHYGESKKTLLSYAHGTYAFHTLLEALKTDPDT